MMKSYVLAAILMLGTVPVVSSALPSFGDGETRFACGKDCPETQLVCARDEEGPAPIALTTQYIATDLPLGQTDYRFLTGTIADRPQSGITDSERLSGPTVVSFGGFDWVWSDYDLQEAQGPDLAGSLVMWPEGDHLAMLRCSFLAQTSARTMIEELARSSRD
jgi:hypothetical protein